MEGEIQPRGELITAAYYGRIRSALARASAPRDDATVITNYNRTRRAFIAPHDATELGYNAPVRILAGPARTRRDN